MDYCSNCGLRGFFSVWWPILAFVAVVVWTLATSGCAARQALPPQPPVVQIPVTKIHKPEGYFISEQDFEKLLESLRQKDAYERALVANQ